MKYGHFLISTLALTTALVPMIAAAHELPDMANLCCVQVGKTKMITLDVGEAKLVFSTSVEAHDTDVIIGAQLTLGRDDVVVRAIEEAFYDKNIIEDGVHLAASVMLADPEKKIVLDLREIDKASMTILKGLIGIVPDIHQMSHRQDVTRIKSADHLADLFANPNVLAAIGVNKKVKQAA